MLVKADLDLENLARIINLLDPTLAQHPATKAYVDALVTAAIEGVKQKELFRVRTTANVNLASPGASLDGVAMSAGQRFYADGQTTGAEKGGYIWNGAATPATRSLDTNPFTELVNALIPIAEGTDAGKIFRQTVATGTTGVTTPVLAAYGTVAGAATESTAGIAEIATQGETDAGSDDTRFVTALKVFTAAWRMRRYIATFGDGAATQYDLTHNLPAGLEVACVVRLASTDEDVLVNIRRFSTTTVRVNLASAPPLNSLKAIITGSAA